MDEQLIRRIVNDELEKVIKKQRKEEHEKQQKLILRKANELKKASNILFCLSFLIIPLLVAIIFKLVSNSLIKNSSNYFNSN